MHRSVLLAAALFLFGSAPVASAQVNADSTEQRALRDFHGADLEGKDGPLAKADLSLLRLYHQHRTLAAQDRTGALEPPMPGMQVADGAVVVDAIATGDPERLVDDFRGLDASNVASSGRLVSARLPISAIAEAAQLSSLQSLRASIAQTNTGGGGPPAPPAADTDTTVQSAPSAESGAGGSGLSMSFIIGAIVFVFIGGAAFAVYMQRKGMPQ
jgi:hypothetical protein